MTELSTPASAKQPFWRAPWFNTLGRFLALLLVFLFFATMVQGGKFYSARNLENIIRQSAVYATAALGMTMVIIAAGIDLSAGSIIALGVVAAAYVLSMGYNPAGGNAAAMLIVQHPVATPLLAMLACVAICSVAGFLNGVMIVRLRLVPFIVTLGTMGIYRGLAKGIGKERDIYPPAQAAATWLNKLMDPVLTSPIPGRKFMLLPPGVWIMLIASILATLMLRYTRLGRHIFAVGSNEETARLCGVPVGRTKIIVYLLAGFFAGLAALMQYATIGIGQPTTAVSYELFIIAAVVIGGASLSGGEGSILGSLIGALMITILYMGGQQMGWPKWVQEMVIGAIIIIAVSIDQLRHRKSV